MKELHDLMLLSKYAGERFDLVQAAGGNTSVKLSDGRMLIKASGFALSEVEAMKGYAIVHCQRVIAIIENTRLAAIRDKKKKDALAARMLTKALITKRTKPSIETFLHALQYRCTLHTHPLAVNAVTCQKNWDVVLKKLFPGAALVSYRTPGIALAVELNKVIKRHVLAFKLIPHIVFIQNHGLIVSADSREEVVDLNEITLRRLERHLGIHLEKYKLTNRISALCNAAGQGMFISYLSEDAEILRILKQKRFLLRKPPYCPDDLVYWGKKILEIDGSNDRKAIQSHLRQYREAPKVIICKNHVFITARNLKKAKEIEEELKCHLLTLDSARGPLNYLPAGELNYLSDWDAEKYRQNK